MKVTLNFVKAIDELTDKIDNVEINKYIIELMKALLERLERGEQKDLEEIHNMTIQRFLTFLNKLFEKYKKLEDKNIKNDVEVFLLSTSLKSENFLWKYNAMDTIKKKHEITTIRINSYYI